MIHIIIGVLAIICGIWWLLPDWMFTSEILKMLVFVGLIVFGVIAVLAGLRRFGTEK
jgi:hypothetical protein